MKTQPKRIFRLAITIVGAAIIGGFLTYVFTRTTEHYSRITDKLMESVAAPDYLVSVQNNPIFNNYPIDIDP
jgi:hypothetical protein